MNDETISVNTNSYHNLVRYYNNHELNENQEYETLVKIINYLKNVIGRVKQLHHIIKFPLFFRNIQVIVAESRPKDFTEFGILVNTGDADLVQHIFRNSTNDLTYFNDQSKFVVFRLDEYLNATEKISVASPVIIAYRNGYIDMLEVIIRNKESNLGELVQEFLEPSLSELTNVKHLKIYDFVKRYYPSNDFPYSIFGFLNCYNAIELAVTYAYSMDNLELVENFMELEGEQKMCNEYFWGCLVYHSIDNDQIKMFCYFAQAGLYIDILHLKYLSHYGWTNIGLHRNILLEFIYLTGIQIGIEDSYLTGVHIGLDELLSLSDEHSENKLSSYLNVPTTLLNLARMCLRKYFGLILPRNTSIFRIINKLNIPNSMISFLKMEDFIHKHFNS